jgi:hypothetical protein
VSENAVIFPGIYDAGRGIFASVGGGVTTIAKTGDPAPVDAFGAFGESPAVDGSAVAFRGHYNLSSQNGITTSDDGIFISSNGTLTTIAKVGDPAPIGTFVSDLSHPTFGDPALSGDTAAFAAIFSGGSGIFTGNGGPFVTIAKVGDPAPIGVFDELFISPSISGDTVAFSASYDSHRESGVFTGNGGQLTTIAKTDDPAPVGTFRGFGGASIVGDTVAFSGTYAAFDQYGIFISNGGILASIIKTGDTLFGSIVDDVEFGRFGLDPSGTGNVAFKYSLTNGSGGVALAIAVPEPSTAWMLSVAMTGAGWTARRRNRRVPA